MLDPRSERAHAFREGFGLSFVAIWVFAWRDMTLGPEHEMELQLVAMEFKANNGGGDKSGEGDGEGVGEAINRLVKVGFTLATYDSLWSLVLCC